MSPLRSGRPGRRFGRALGVALLLLGTAAGAAHAAVNLSASKTDTDDNGGQPRPSEVITYTITVANSGTTGATNVILTDVLPAGTTFLPGTLASDDGTDVLVEGNPLQVLIGALAAAGGGDSDVVITFKVQVNNNAAGGSVVSNQATITADGPLTVLSDDPATGAAGDATQFTVVNPLDISLTKTRDVATQSPGGDIVYTLSYANAGSVSATNVSISDFVPSNTTFQSATGGGTLSGGVVAWNIGSIAAGGSGSRQFTVRVNSGVVAGTVISNSGTISFQDDLGNTQEPKTSATVTTTVAQGAAVVANPDQTGSIKVGNGNNITYTFTVTNTGNGTDRFDLTDVKVQTPFAVQIELLNGAGTVIATDNATANGTWDTVLGAADTDGDGNPDTGNMLPGATQTFQVRLTKTIGGCNGCVDITRILATSNFNPAVSDTVTFTTTVSPNNVGITVTKTDAPDPVAAGANITYTITVLNSGSQGLTGMTIDDTVPANTTFVSASGGGTLAGGVVTWAIGALAAGASVSRTLTVQVGAAVANGTVITNTASVIAVETGGAGNPTQSTTTTTVQSPVSFVTSSKTVNFAAATPGATLTYTLSVVNSGVSPATGVVVTDTVPAITTYVAGSITGAGADASGAPNLVWNVGNLAAGATVNLTYEVLVNNPVPAGTTSVTNDATIDSNETLPVMTNLVTTNITASPNFTLSTKSVSDLNGGLVTTGDILRYTVVVRNSGNMSATGVVATDTLPANTTYVPGSITGTGADDSAAPDLSWAVGPVNGAGATVTLRYDVVIGDAVAGGTVISNFATADSDQTAPVNTTTSNATVQAGFSGTLASTPTINPGQGVTITLTDRNLNANPAVAETVSLTTVNTVTGESELLTYTETGAATGVFTAAVATVFGTTAGANNDGSFNVQAGDILRTTYNDAFTATGGVATVTADTSVVTSCASGAISASVAILPGQGIAVTVTDNDLNGNAAAAETTTVTVANPATGENETLTLTETGPDTGVFTGTLSTSEGVVSDPAVGVLAVAKDDVVTSSYADACTGTGGPATASDTTTIVKPVLTVSKSDAPDPVAAGANLTYTIDYSNTGTASATGVAITDTVPANTAFVSATGGGSLAGGVVTWNIGIVAAGGSGSVTLTVQVASPLANGTVLTNGVYAIDSNETVPVAGAAVATTVTAAPVLAISKSDSADPVPAGTNITYTLNYSNSGNMNASGVVVTDTVPVNTTFVSATGGGTEAGGIVTWNLGPLNAGSSGSVTLTVQVNTPLPNGTVITNGTYGIDSSETAPAGGAAVTTTVTSDPILNIGKTDGPDPAVAGTDNITYTINYSNTGTADATGVVITDTVPASTTFVSATGGGTLGGGVVTWNIGNLAAGASGSVQLVVSIVTPIANNATITNGAYAIDCNETAAVNGAAATTTVLSDPRFVLTKTDAPDPVAAGGAITYTLGWQNVGTNNATGVVVQDPLPANTAFVSATGGGTLAAGVVTWNVGNVAAGASGSVQLVVQVASPLADGTTITDTGWTIDSNESLPQTGPDATTTVTSAPILNVTKTDAPDPVAAGANVTYSIAYSNTGNENATGVVLTDVIPANTAFVSATGGGVLAGGVVTWNLGALAAGASGTVDLVVQVTSPLPNGTVIDNATYSIDSNETAPVNGAAVQTTVTSLPILGVTKTDGPDPVVAGANITYTLAYSNTGTANASGVVITDTIPANAVFVSATAGGTLAGGVVTWNIGALNAGGSGSVQLVVRAVSPLPNGTVITNATYAIDSNETAPAAGAAATTTVTSAPILAVGKSEAADPVAAGSNLTYTITYTNTGNENASGVVITDTVPANTAFVSATGGGTLAGGVVTWNVGALNAGSNGSVQLVVAVASPLPNGTVITNATYALDSTQTAPVAGAAVTTTVTSAPVLTISKTDAPDPVNAGSNVTYTIAYANTGNMNASAVVITDTVPANTTFVSATGGGALAGGVVTWNLGALNAGTNGTVQLVVAVSSPLPNGTILTNGAYSIDSAETVPVAGAAATTTVQSAPILNISKTDAPDPVAAGANLNYTLAYSNTGNANAGGVVITDTVPANTTFLSATGGGTLAGGVVTWNLGALNAGASGSVQLVVAVTSPLPNGTVITNGTFGIDSTETSPTSGAAITTTVASAPILTISKSESADPIAAGGTLTYTIAYANTGNMNASGAVITDTVPADTTFVSATGGGTLAGGVVTWNIGILGAGTNGTVQLVVAVASPLPNGTVITNGAYAIDSAETVPVAGAAVTTTVASAPNLTISKIESADPVAAGGSITYTLAYANTGNMNASGAVITDTVPADTTFASATGGGSLAGGVVTWNLGALNAGVSASVQMTVTVDSPLPNGTILSNDTYALDSVETAPVAGAAVTTTVTSDPILSVGKTDGPDPAVAGTDNITYTLAYSNAGNADATGSVLTDTVPAGTTFVSATGGGTLAGGVVTWNLGVVPAGGSGSVQMVVSIDTPVANGAVVTNGTYAIDCNETAPVGGAAATTTVLSDVRFTLTKTDAPDPVAAGASITYTLGWQNTGTSNATGVVLRDPIPANTTFVSATGGGAPAAGVVTWNLGNVAAGASGSVQLVVQVASPLANGTGITNTGWTIDSNESLPQSGPDATTTVTSAPVLTLSKTDAPDPVSPGGTITYTLSYGNTGNEDATGVVITDVVPGNTTFVSATGGGSVAGGVVTWNLGALNAGASGSVQLVVQVVSPLPNGTVISNASHQIDSDQTSPAAGAAVGTTVSSAPVLNISKTDNPDPVNAGSDITYTIAWSNTGTADATGTVITDAVPADTTFVSATGGGTEAAGTVTWNIGLLPAGASGSAQLVVRVVTPLPNGTVITNGAYAIDSNETAPVAGAAVATTVNSVPVLSISKTAAPDPVAAGGTITYTLTANNTGTADATGTVITDTLPANTAFVSATGGGTLAGGVVTWNAGVLAASGTVIRQLVVQVASPLPDGTILSNDTYDVDAIETTPVAGVPVGVTVTATPSLAATKAFADLDGGALEPGDTIRYTITVTNSGNGTATNVVLGDSIPANTTLVPGSLASNDGSDLLTEGNPLTAALGSIGATAAVVTFEVAVGAGVADGTPISNQGMVTADGPIALSTDDPSTGAAGDATVRTVTAVATPFMTGTVADLNGGSLNPGDTLEYTLTLTNTGSADANAVVVTDPVPAGTTYVAASITGPGADDTGLPNLVWNVGALAAGGTATLTYRVTVDLAATSGTMITNQAALTAAGGISLISDDPAVNDGAETGNAAGDPADDDPTILGPVFLGDVLQVTIGTDTEAARRGEFILFTVTLTNPTAGDVASVDLSALVPAGVKVLPGTLTLDGVPQADPAPAIPLVIPVGTVLAGGGTRVLTYRAVLTAGAPLGPAETTALAQDAAAQPLSPATTHVLVVIEDAEFDLATLIGKVFDDKDGNGVQGIGERGIGGVMVAMEDGVYALTDGNGLYHIAAVRPGNRLIKIARHTLPPHETLTLPEAQTLTVTPGLLVKANFGVRLRPPTLVRQGRPGTYGLAVQNEKVEAPAEIIGNLEDMTAVVNGVRARLPKTRVKMDVMSLERNLRLVNGRLERPAVFRLSYPKDRTVREWTFEIFDASLRRIRGFRGNDLKTGEVVWDGKDAGGALVKAGSIYQYQLTLEFTDGSLSKSPLRMFGVNRTQAIAFELTGASFDVDTARLKPEAGSILGKIVDTLKRHPDEKVVVRGHTDNTGSRDWNRSLSQKRAEAVRDYLVLSGIAGERLVVEGRGSDQPVASNTTEAGRARNRRVEIKALLEETERAGTGEDGASGVERQVVVNGRNVPVEEDGTFRTTVDSLKDGGRVYVGIRTEDGGVAAATVKLPSIAILEPTTDVRLEIGKREDVIKLMQPRQAGGELVYPTVKIPVSGRTEAGNQVFIDGGEVEVGKDGRFRTDLPLAVGENTFGVVAVSPNGYTSLVNLAVDLSGLDKDRNLVLVRKPVPQFSIELPARGAVLSSPTLFVRGTAPKNATVTVNTWRLPVLPNGTFAGTVRLPEGPSILNVVVNMPNSTEGRVGVPIEVRSGYFFLVALGDATVNKITTEGRVPDRYTDDLYVDGRLALYMKGRIQGKYLLTAGLDTGDGRLSDIGSRLNDRDNSQFYRNLDPDAFYPVYGDGSRTVKDTNSQGRFYVLFEAPSWDAQWGNYNSGITGNEFASFNRSLYGAKGTWHSLAKGKDGKPLGQAIVFMALPETRAAHDEFTGTGGSLYLLRNRDVVPGSEKVRLEVRDKITGIPVANVTRRNYVDYEIDYATGRILFREPVQSVTTTGTLISEGFLNGNPVAVVVDYEYRTAGVPTMDDTTYGARVKHALGDHLSVGATYVQENRTSGTYTLSGGDVSVKVGETAQITAEFSQSENQSLARFASSDGGLSFQAQTVPLTTEPAQAYRLELAGGRSQARFTTYVRHLDAGFSSSFAAGQAESDQIGGSAAFRLGKNAALDLLLDSKEVAGFATERTGTLQYRHTFGRFGVTAEARYRDTDSVAGTDTTEGIGALRFDYRPAPRLNLFARVQDDFLQDAGDPLFVFEPRRQAAVGLEAQVSEKITAKAELISAENGDGALVGLTSRVDPRTMLYGTYTMTPDQAGVRTGALTLGAATAVGERSRLYTEEQFRSSERESAASQVVGLSTRFNDRFTTNVAFERSRSDAAAAGTPDVLRQAGSVSGSYANPWIKIFSKYEIRTDEDPAATIDRDQWLTTNAVELKLSRDLSVTGRFSYGETVNNDTLDESIFREQSVGFALRPVAWDWIHVLARYTEVRNLPTIEQAALNRDETTDRVLSLQTVVDLHRRLSLTEKFAVRDRTLDPQAAIAELKSRMTLWVNRFNYRFSDLWDAALEYRVLAMEEAGDNAADGFLLEINRLLFGHLRVGAGYNFTEFTDNEFQANDYSAKGFFFRVQGKY